jgi:hypothetical protein
MLCTTLLYCLDKTDIRMPCVSVAAQHCPEPFNMTDLDYIITSGYVSCYGGYNVQSRVEYFCAYNPNSEPHKTFECGREGNWTEIDETPLPSCVPENITTQPNSTIPQTDQTDPGMM